MASQLAVRFRAQHMTPLYARTYVKHGQHACCSHFTTQSNTTSCL